MRGCFKRCVETVRAISDVTLTLSYMGLGGLLHRLNPLTGGPGGCFLRDWAPGFWRARSRSIFRAMFCRNPQRLSEATHEQL